MAKLETLKPVSNGAKPDVDFAMPYVVSVTIEGSASMLFHAWNNEAVEAKGASAKGSKSKKTDNTESYVYRDGDRFICLPGEYLRQSVIHAAKFRQDPRSPRKSAMDLYKAGVVSLTELAPVLVGGRPTSDWDYLDRRRVVIMRSAITRERPAFHKGWRAKFDVQVLLPEYVERDALLEVIGQAGRLVGVGDFRPTYGRFAVVSFDVQG